MSIVFLTQFGWIPNHLGESSQQTALLEACPAFIPLFSTSYDFLWNHKLLCFWFVKIDYWLAKAQPTLLEGFALGRLLASPRAAFADPTLGKIPATTFPLTDAQGSNLGNKVSFSPEDLIWFDMIYVLLDALAWHRVGILGFFLAVKRMLDSVWTCTNTQLWGKLRDFLWQWPHPAGGEPESFSCEAVSKSLIPLSSLQIH